MQSIGYMKVNNVKENLPEPADGDAKEREHDAKLTDGYSEWVAAKDEEIGFWESLYPYWF